MIKLSAVIITLNEEKNIQRCIESVQEIADEIIVIDSFSTDKTKEICENFQVKFIEQKFLGHIGQKNFALEKASSDYILSIDADEALDIEAVESIKEIKINWNKDGYFINRLTNYCDKWIYHCGWYPDKKLRLIDRRKAKWGGVNPHDIIIMSKDSSTSHLPGKILHYSYPSIESHITQTNKFTTIAAKEAYTRGVRSTLIKAYSRALFKFSRDYFFKRGFLDGTYGAIICYINALSAFLKYSKIIEIEKTEKNT